MIGLKTYFKKRNAKFNSAYAPPPKQLPSLGLVLSGSTVVIIGLGISTIAIHNYSQTSDIGPKTVIQLTGNAVDTGDRAERHKFSSQQAQNNASQLQGREIPQIVNRLHLKSQQTRELTDRSVGDVPQIQTHSTEAFRAEIEDFQDADFLDSTADSTAHEDRRRYLADGQAIGQIGTIAPASGFTFPEDIVATESTELQVSNSANDRFVTADDKAWRIQLASLRNRSTAEAAWTRLQHTNPDLLNDLSLRIQSARLSKGTFYRVQAGPLHDRAAAASLCQSFRSRKQDCLIVAP